MQATQRYQILLIGGSAGSLEVILPLLEELREGFCMAVVIVMHRRTDTESRLTELIASRSGLPVKEAEEKDKIEPGTIYVAPADYHLLIEKDHTFSLDYSEKVHYSRPSIDVSFEAAADAYGDAVAALLLSGANDDGTSGLEAIKNAGGLALVQDPEAAVVPYMPMMAIKHVDVDRVLRNLEMAPFLNSLC